MNKKLFAAILLSGIAFRLVPHIPNFSPISAIALFSGFYFSKKYSWTLPLSIMLISDLILGISPISIFVYGSFFLVSILGVIMKGHDGLFEIGLSSVVSSLLFFVITNFGVWLTTNMYAHDIVGLYQSYLMGIPFLKSTLISDIFFNSLFFSAYYLTQNRVLSTSKGRV